MTPNWPKTPLEQKVNFASKLLRGNGPKTAARVNNQLAGKPCQLDPPLEKALFSDIAIFPPFLFECILSQLGKLEVKCFVTASTLGANALLRQVTGNAQTLPSL